MDNPNVDEYNRSARQITVVTSMALEIFVYRSGMTTTLWYPDLVFL